MTPELRLRVALHEAAHAVLAYLSRHPVLVVSIADGEAIRGFCKVAWRQDLGMIHAGVDNIASTLAGEQAEYLALEDLGVVDPADVGEAVTVARAKLADQARAEVDAAAIDADPSGDHAHAADIARLAGGPEWALVLAIGQARAVRQVREYPDVIRAFAAELLRRQIIAGPAIGDIIGAPLKARKEFEKSTTTSARSSTRSSTHSIVH
jgi:hypothetical protein